MFWHPAIESRVMMALQHAWEVEPSRKMPEVVTVSASQTENPRRHDLPAERLNIGASDWH